MIRPVNIECLPTNLTVVYAMRWLEFPAGHGSILKIPGEIAPSQR